MSNDLSNSLGEAIASMNYAHQRRKNGDTSYSNLGVVQKRIVDAAIFSNIIQKQADMIVTNLVTNSRLLGISKDNDSDNDNILNYVFEACKKSENMKEERTQSR